MQEGEESWRLVVDVFQKLLSSCLLFGKLEVQLCRLFGIKLSQITNRQFVNKVHQERWSGGSPYLKGYRRDVDEVCALLGCYTLQRGNLTTFRDNPSVPSARAMKSKKKLSSRSLVVSFLPDHFTPEGESRQFPLYRRLDVVEKTMLPVREISSVPRVSIPVLVTVPTVMSTLRTDAEYNTRIREGRK